MSFFPQGGRWNSDKSKAGPAKELVGKQWVFHRGAGAPNSATGSDFLLVFPTCRSLRELVGRAQGPIIIH